MSRSGPKVIWFLALAIVSAAFLLPALAAGDNKTEGKIKKIEQDKKEFVVTAKDDAKDYKFKVDPTAKIQVNNQPGMLADLKLGDRVTVTWRKEAGQMLATKIECKRK
jgi:hypothetical protein